MKPAIIGTLIITGAATAMAVPLGVLGGIWLNEYGTPRRLASLIRFLADVMTGVPSIVMGLFVYTFLVLRTHETNAFFGAIALACLMLPVVIRTTEEMLAPRSGRPARGEHGAREGARPGRSGGWCCRPPSRASSAVPCSRWPGPRARPRRCSSPSASRSAVNTNLFSGSEHRAPGPDLRQRQLGLPGGAGPGVGRRADADRDRLRLHDPRPDRLRPLRSKAARMSAMDTATATVASTVTDAPTTTDVPAPPEPGRRAAPG